MCATPKKFSVYVIELDPEVANDPRWKHGGDDTNKYYYVGQSVHSPECRFEQHRAPKHSLFHCICYYKRGKEVRRHPIGSAKFASTHGVRLAPELFQDRNPRATAADAIKAEKELTQHLRDLGHGAYSK